MYSPYGIYLLEADGNTSESRRRTTKYYEGRTFKMRDLPINHHRNKSEVLHTEDEKVLVVRLGSLPPQLTTIVGAEINGVRVGENCEVSLRPPTDSETEVVYRISIDRCEFDLVVFIKE